MNRSLIAKNNQRVLIFLLVFLRLLQHGGVAAANAHHEVTEGTGDVLTATLEGGVIRGIHQVHFNWISSLRRKTLLHLYVRPKVQMAIHSLYIFLSGIYPL